MTSTMAFGSCVIVFGYQDPRDIAGQQRRYPAVRLVSNEFHRSTHSLQGRLTQCFANHLAV